MRPALALFALPFTAPPSLRPDAAVLTSGSGDFAIAFSTAPSARLKRPSTRPASYEAITTDALNPLFEMALEATEEAVDNSLLQATPVRSRFGSAAAIPIEKLKDVLAKYGLKP